MRHVISFASALKPDACTTACPQKTCNFHGGAFGGQYNATSRSRRNYRPPGFPGRRQGVIRLRAVIRRQRTIRRHSAIRRQAMRRHNAASPTTTQLHQFGFSFRSFQPPRPRVPCHTCMRACMHTYIHICITSSIPHVLLLAAWPYSRRPWHI